jgi:porin
MLDDSPEQPVGAGCTLPRGRPVAIAAFALCAFAWTDSVRARPPLDLDLSYTAEAWANASGGLTQGIRYLDLLFAGATLDGGRAFGWAGTTARVSGFHANGASLSGDLVGDAQIVSNIETGVPLVRLHEAWLQVPLAGDRVSLKLGLYDLNSEFDVNETGSLFIQSSHGIGAELALSGRNGPSMYPFTGLAARLGLKLGDRWSAKFAVLDGVPSDPDRPRRFATLRLNAEEGALLIGELVNEGPRHRLALGHWRYTAAFKDQRRSASAGEAVEARGNAGAYALLEAPLLTAASGAESPLSGWVRLGVADARFNPVDLYVGSGLTVPVTLSGRQAGHAGIAAAFARFSGRWRQSQGAQGVMTDGHELALEATYRAPLGPHVTVQPGVQYVVNPGGRSGVPDALVIGLRARLAF